MFFFSNKTPRPRGIYAVNSGQYIGEFLVYMETKDDLHIFLSLPKMLKRYVPDKSFKVGLKQKILVIVEVLPKDVYTVCKQQYEQTYKKLAGKTTKD